MKYIKQIQLWQKQNYCLFIISMFLFVGCTPTTISNLANPATATWISNQSDMLTQITQESISQQSTATNPPQFGETLTVTLLPASSIPLPTIISSTPTPPSTPTPVPTLTGEQNTEYFIRLMKRNGDCELPCWWGIIPGESKIETIAEQFVPLGLVWLEEWKQLEGISSGSGVIVTFTLEENVIQSIKVWGGKEDDRFVQDWERYSLDQVLTRYGMPSDVFVYYPYRPDPGSSASYNLSIFYEELGIEISYAGEATDIDGEKSRACPKLDNVSLINLLLYQPTKINNIVETVIPPETVSFIAGPDTVYDLISWEQATNTTLESFYETFSQPNPDACFDFRRYWTSSGE